MRSHDHHDEGAVEAREGTYFTGPVWAEVRLPHDNGAGVNRVTFAPRSRTHWHSHEGGQMLLGAAGAGLVVTREGLIARIGEGMTVHGDAGEEHWHGAMPNAFMTHISVGLSGSTEWLGPVTDAEYDTAVDHLEAPLS
jgi:quercetin dioxygenase-like cupin family protein